MRYWDASALVPLIVSETSTKKMANLYRSDAELVTWGWTKVEIVSAIERRTREGSISRSQRRECLEALDRLAAAWDEVVDIAAVRLRAVAILARQNVRAADAAQLGAALLVSEDQPGSIELVCLDERLAQAAEREGFRVAGV